MRKTKGTRSKAAKKTVVRKPQSNDQQTIEEKKLVHVIEGLGKVLDSYEKENRSWFTDTILELIEGGLYSLRHFIEDGKDKSITWENAIGEFRYAVEWNWEAWKSQSSDSPHQICGQITSKDLRNSKNANRKLTEMAIQFRNVFVLNSLTKDVAWEKRGRKWLRIVPSEVARSLSKLSPAHQERVLAELYRPFSFGTFEVEVPIDAVGESGRVSDAESSAIKAKSRTPQARATTRPVFPGVWWAMLCPARNASAPPTSQTSRLINSPAAATPTCPGAMSKRLARQTR
jgi:hypothetical protein